MSVRETQNGTPRGAFFCGFCRSPEGAAAACSGYVHILRDRGARNAPTAQKQRNMPQVFTHVGNIRYHRLGDGSGIRTRNGGGYMEQQDGNQADALRA